MIRCETDRGGTKYSQMSLALNDVYLAAIMSLSIMKQFTIMLDNNIMCSTYRSCVCNLLENLKNIKTIIRAITASITIAAMLPPIDKPT